VPYGRQDPRGLRISPQLTQLNISVDEYDSLYLEHALIAIHKLVLAEIAAKYTLIDEELC
jgi:hypothetical protein